MAVAVLIESADERWYAKVWEGKPDHSTVYEWVLNSHLPIETHLQFDGDFTHTDELEYRLLLRKPLTGCGMSL